MTRWYSIGPIRERDGTHTKGRRSALANRKAKVLAAERKGAFMVRYRAAKDKGGHDG